MPYRRLPNTDQARLRSLKQATHKADMLRVYDLAFSQKILVRIQSFLPSFEKALTEYQQVMEQQNRQGNAYRELLKNARMYVSHFIQVLNMAVLRGEIKPEQQLLYGLEAETRCLPDLSADYHVYEWGQKIIDGERTRIMHGGTPIYTPSIANVKVKYERFKESYNRQKYSHSNLERHHNTIISLRETADELIADLWNQIESYYSEENDQNKKIESCKDYGIIYYYRKEEQKSFVS